MTVVQVDADQVPELQEWLLKRHEWGLDTYDEWWNGVYRIVTGPTPEHGELTAELLVFLHPLVKWAGLRGAAPVNVGINREECRVPDIGIYAPDTPRTSPAFLQTALLVVEILSPGEKPGAKLDFYADWGIAEYLEISLTDGTVELRHRDEGTWTGPMDASGILNFSVGASTLTNDRTGEVLDVADYRIR